MPFAQRPNSVEQPLLTASLESLIYFQRKPELQLAVMDFIRALLCARP